MKKTTENKLKFVSSVVGVVPNVVLNKKERKEVEDSIKEIRKVKLPKKCYFNGFIENKD